MSATDYQKVVFPYRRHADQDSAVPCAHPVVIIGAGPVGLCAAIDLAQRGVPVVVLDDDNRLSVGSRAICFAKRTLEIFDRLQCGDRMLEKGVSWNVGRVFFKDEPVYDFNLLPEPGHQRPAFINLQQYYAEGFLQERATQLPLLDLRWNNKLVGLTQQSDAVSLQIDTPDGAYSLCARYVIAADGSRSPTRALMKLESRGEVFHDRFLIADIKMTAPFPTERWFWFDPPFHPNQSVLLHRQPDNVWRVDFQLGWDADPVAEKSPERVLPRLRALFGPDVDFTLEWVSVYTFSCMRMEKFRHGRVLFAGDAAHLVSPFGARGANSGVQDADNLGWKLALVLSDQAPDTLLDSYASEREFAADENLRNSTRSTDFITPKSTVSRVFRDAVLTLSRQYPFARRLVNSGRLSLPASYVASPLNTADKDMFAAALSPGAPCADAPLRAAGKPAWLLPQLGSGFTLLLFIGAESLGADERDVLQRLRAQYGNIVTIVTVSMEMAHADAAFQDSEGLLAQRYDARAGTAYLLRPDAHVCARWRRLSFAEVSAALDRSRGIACETLAKEIA